VAAIERFMRATAPPPRPDESLAADGWRAAAFAEGVARDPSTHTPDTWLGVAS